MNTGVYAFMYAYVLDDGTISNFSGITNWVSIIDVYYSDKFVELKFSNILDTEIRYPTIQSTSPLANGTLGQIRMIFATIGWKF